MLPRRQENERLLKLWLGANNRHDLQITLDTRQCKEYWPNWVRTTSAHSNPKVTGRTCIITKTQWNAMTDISVRYTCKYSHVYTRKRSRVLLDPHTPTVYQFIPYILLRFFTSSRFLRRWKSPNEILLISNESYRVICCNLIHCWFQMS